MSALLDARVPDTPVVGRRPDLGRRAGRRGEPGRHVLDELGQPRDRVAFRVDADEDRPRARRRTHRSPRRPGPIVAGQTSGQWVYPKKTRTGLAAHRRERHRPAIRSGQLHGRGRAGGGQRGSVAGSTGAPGRRSRRSPTRSPLADGDAPAAAPPESRRRTGARRQDPDDHQHDQDDRQHDDEAERPVEDRSSGRRGLARASRVGPLTSAGLDLGLDRRSRPPARRSG